MANGAQFKLTLVDGLSGPANAGSRALKSVEKSLRAVSASAKAIVPMKPITVTADKASQKAAASEAARAEKAANKQRIADERAAAKAIIAQEKQLQAEKKALAQAALAEWKAIDKRNAAQEKAALKLQSQAAKEQAKAQKAAKQEATKAAKKAAEAQTAAGEAFAEEAAATAAAATAAATAVLALAAAFGAAVFAGAKLALEASEAKGDTLDMLQAFLGSQEAAESTYDAIQDITRDVAISQGRAQELAQTLTAAGINNKDMLLDAIQAIGQVDSVIKGAGDKVQAIIERAQTAGKFQLNAKQLVGTGVQMQDLFQSIAAATGKGVKQVEAELKAGKISAEVGVAALTKTIDKKFGALAGKQLLDFGNQVQRFKDNIGRLFEDVDTGPFLEALKTVADLFDTSTTAGNALKESVTAIFDGLFSAAAAALPYVKTLFKGLIIIGLQFYIGLKPLLKALGLIGTTAKGSGDGTKTLAAAMTKVGEVVGFVTGIFAKFLAHKPVLVALGIAAGLVVLPFILMQAAITAVIGAFVGLLAIGASIGSWLLNLGAEAWNAGTALVDGLIKGISDAAGKLVATVQNLGKQAVTAFKDVFQIHSPSRVMAGLGTNLSLGLAQGIAAGAPAVNDNMTAVLEPIAPPRVAGSSQGTTSTVTVSGNTFTFVLPNVTNAEEFRSEVTPILADLFEQAVMTKGLDPSNPQAA